MQHVVTTKKAIIAAGAVLFVIAAITLYSFSKKDGSGIAVRILSGEADLEVQNFHYTEVGDPDSRWEVNADKALYIKKKEEVSLTKVRLKLLSRDGRVYRMTAMEGILHRDSGDIELTGNVVAISDAGERVEAENMKYSSLNKIVYTDEDVFLKNNDIEVVGRGMKYYLEKDKLVLFSQVKAVIDKDVS
ncbi:MAG: LPS export ABC transporter periplasmic protein LptC [Syntrophales bacterium]|nr:LPS export ABC transporter periplasmic protein LptC [Syntrophales bacterium]MDY0043290.1 LPS export ABC transporter periplasmic protein LptC [Syntrophales bacterium]